MENLLARIQMNDPSARCLDMQQLDEQSLRLFVSAAKHTRVIEELTVSLDQVTSGGWKQFASLLNTLGNLASLTITCPSSSRADCWFQFFSTIDPQAIAFTKLYLDTAALDRPFHPHEQDTISHFFRDNKSITSLELVCYDGDEEETEYDNIGCDSDGCTFTDCILEALATNNTVKSLCLADYVYSCSGRGSLEAFLGLNEGVTTLECISDTPALVATLIDGLQYNCRPREIRVSNMGEDASAAFFSGFSTANNVPTLEVTNCCLSGKALLPFVHGIRKNAEIRALAVGLGEDTTLSDFIMQGLAPALINHPSLKEVNIQDVENQFEHVGASALGDALIQNFFLEKLVIHSQEVTNNAALFLGLRIPSIQFLKSLTLVGSLREGGKALIAEKLKHNYSLTEVLFDPPETTSNAEKHIKELTKRNQRIEVSKVVVPINRITTAPLFSKAGRVTCKSTLPPPPSKEILSPIGFR